MLVRLVSVFAFLICIPCTGTSVYVLRDFVIFYTGPSFYKSHCNVEAPRSPNICNVLVVYYKYQINLQTTGTAQGPCHAFSVLTLLPYRDCTDIKNKKKILAYSVW